MMPKNLPSLGRWTAFGYFVLHATIAYRISWEFRFDLFRILGETIAWMCVVCGMGVLFDHQRPATKLALFAGLAWFCYRGGVDGLLLAVFALGPFSIGLLWMTPALIGLVAAYLFLMHEA